MTFRASCLLAFSFSITLVACGSDAEPTGTGGSATTTTATTTGTGGSVATRTPKVHRAAEIACTGARPPGGGGFGTPTDKCMSDAECTQGTNGRCVAALGQPTFCSYDECAGDMDCGSVTVCECRAVANYQANTCIHGTCRIDADCGASGFCSPSAVGLDAGCLFGITQGSVGYFCHAPADECVDDDECGGAGSGICIFSVDQKHWVCKELICAG